MKDLKNRRQLLVRQFDLPVGYRECWQSMMLFTQNRDRDQADEVWLLEHPPVFTTGIRDSADSILDPGDIPVVNTDRGGLVTYHGPGQLVTYLLLNLRRLGCGLKSLVASLEQVTINLLASYDIEAMRKQDAPGVYVNDRKVASLGLRVQHGCTYHGLSLNVDMDLDPFARIVPCGLEGMVMTDMKSLGVETSVDEIGRQFVQLLADELGYNPRFVKQGEQQ